ncbi:MAG: hypothetical protein HYS09_04655 [Chloroflexi bacterium]|nr:hypothetical protein [Chloroflexota bacterium]
MFDPLYDELMVKATLADRDREAREIVRTAALSHVPRSLRAGFAARLARIALRLDREAARDWLSGDAGRPITNGSPS